MQSSAFSILDFSKTYLEANQIFDQQYYQNVEENFYAFGRLLTYFSRSVHRKIIHIFTK